MELPNCPECGADGVRLSTGAMLCDDPWCRSTWDSDEGKPVVYLTDGGARWARMDVEVTTEEIRVLLVEEGK